MRPARPSSHAQRAPWQVTDLLELRPEDIETVRRGLPLGEGRGKGADQGESGCRRSVFVVQVEIRMIAPPTPRTTDTHHLTWSHSVRLPHILTRPLNTVTPNPTTCHSDISHYSPRTLVLAGHEPHRGEAHVPASGRARPPGHVQSLPDLTEFFGRCRIGQVCRRYPVIKPDSNAYVDTPSVFPIYWFGCLRLVVECV